MEVRGGRGASFAIITGELAGLLIRLDPLTLSYKWLQYQGSNFIKKTKFLRQVVALKILLEDGGGIRILTSSTMVSMRRVLSVGNQHFSKGVFNGHIIRLLMTLAIMQASKKSSSSCKHVP